MTVRKILEDAPLGRVFTNVQKTSVATAANLIAGDKPRSMNASYVQKTTSDRSTVYVNLKYNKYSTLLANVTPTLITEGGLITQISFNATTPSLVGIGFYNKVTKGTRGVANPQLNIVRTINGSTSIYTTFVGSATSWYAPAVYSNLTIPFTSDEILYFLIVKSYSVVASNNVTLNTTYYSDPIKA